MTCSILFTVLVSRIQGTAAGCTDFDLSACETMLENLQSSGMGNVAPTESAFCIFQTSNGMCTVSCNSPGTSCEGLSRELVLKTTGATGFIVDLNLVCYGTKPDAKCINPNFPYFPVDITTTAAPNITSDTTATTASDTATAAATGSGDNAITTQLTQEASNTATTRDTSNTRIGGIRFNATSSTEVNCKYTGYPFDSSCSDDPGEKTTECALEIHTEVNLCVLNHLYDTSNVQEIIGDTVREIVEDFKPSSFECSRDKYYPYGLIAAKNEDVSQVKADEVLNDTPTADNCPSVDDICNDYLFNLECSVALRCSKCELLEELRNEILASGTAIETDFEGKCLEKSKKVDTECDVGFGNVEVAKLVMRFMSENGQEITHIVGVNNSGAVFRKYFLGGVVMLAVLGIMC